MPHLVSRHAYTVAAALLPGAMLASLPWWSGSFDSSTFADLAERLVADASALLELGLARSPAVVLALALALTLPGIALSSAIIRSAWRLYRGHQRRRSRPAVKRAVTPAPGRAWLDVHAEGRIRRMNLAGELTRIGRDDDNELPLRSEAVAPCHALIRRTLEAEYLIVDVSRQDGTGLTVNGRRRAWCTLTDGDRIELGPTTVTFHRAGNTAPPPQA